MKKSTVILLSTVLCATLANAGKINQVFEAPKDTSSFEKVEFDFKADLTFNYQMLDQTYTPTSGTAKELQAGLILPTANLDIYAKVMSGFNVKLQTMLSSHHHNETYVKGGEATIDNLDFISPDFGASFMKYATIKIGVNDINFGDAHFMRTDNANVFKNPFVHNLAVESYMQAGFIEVLYRIPSYNSIAMIGATNGQVNPDDVVASSDSSPAPAIYAKVAYDKQLSDALRFRVSESLLHTDGNGNNSLYNGDKAGTVSREILGSDDFGSGWKAMGSYKDLTVSMTNAFVKYNNTELFALLELAESNDREMTHYSIDLVQRFAGDKFYIAGRYENATVSVDGASADEELTQYQLAAGWFFSKNAMAKIEYINQERENLAVSGRHTAAPAEFDGVMLTAALTF